MTMSPAFNPVFARQGTTIFTVMSALANEHKAVNLGQGFPDLDGPESVRAVAAKALMEGPTQYPPLPGLPELRQQLSAQAKKRKTRPRKTQNQTHQHHQNKKKKPEPVSADAGAAGTAPAIVGACEEILRAGLRLERRAACHVRRYRSAHLHQFEAG